MKGYYQKPRETAKIFKNGWLCTGDIAVMNKDGYFKIVDQKKDMILISGFNVYPNEIEDYICDHPKVLECAAIGIPNEKTGEAPKVFIVKKDESLTVEEVKAWCVKGLTRYKHPREYEFVTDLPKTNVGKIKRNVLKE
jgi:long-chain acyl-CoA synthetase